METFGLHIDRVESLADKNSTTSRVNLMTVHASKGLEFDVVFVTGLEVRDSVLGGETKCDSRTWLGVGGYAARLRWWAGGTRTNANPACARR